jgi:hypothetical protein
MAKETAVTLFIGVDHTFTFEILNEAEDAAINVTGVTLSWMLKRNVNHDDADALLTKTTSAGITITGVYNAIVATNTQRVVVTIADSDTDAIKAGIWRYELKRMDAGNETIYAYGKLTLTRSVHHA